jgi:hypothetical protein
MSGWAEDWKRGAGGRRRYNASRKRLAQQRRREIAKAIDEAGGLPVGMQAQLARRFKVSESTISRDMIGILGEREAERCKCCGGIRPRALAARIEVAHAQPAAASSARPAATETTRPDPPTGTAGLSAATVSVYGRDPGAGAASLERDAFNPWG